MAKLTKQVRGILTDAFTFPGLRTLYLAKSGTLTARVRVHSPEVEARAFEAFQAAVDRLVLEAPAAPFIVWAGVTTELVSGAKEVTSCE